MKKKQRLIWTYAILGVATVAVCTGVALAVLSGDDEIPTEGLVPGVTDMMARSTPASAPALRFTAIPIDFRHFSGGRRTHRLPEDMGSGVAVEDFDGDGRVDIFLVDSGPLGTTPEPCALFQNLGDFRFRRVDTELPRLMGMGVAAADYDADGDFDLYVTGYGRNVLLRNDGGFVFTDVTAEAGVAGGGFSAGACWGDADRDGDLDLYVCRYVRFDEQSAPAESRRGSTALPATLNPSVYPAESNLLYLNEGDGRFREAAEEFGVANPRGKSLGALFADFNADGILDLYVANDVTDNVFFLGQPDGAYVDKSHASCTADWRGAMGLAAGDPDLDGDLDLFITHWKPEENALYVREEGLLFRDDSMRSYLGPPGRGLVSWATDFADFDRDGRPDLYVVNGDTFEEPEARTQLVAMIPQIFWNGGRRFWDLAPQAGIALSKPIVGRGGTHGDFDGDGDIDLIFIAHGGMPLLLRNDTETENRELVIEVRGSEPNLFAYGASVTVETGDLKQIQQVGARVSYLSSGPHTLHFGLGRAKHADKVIVRFSSGAMVERRHVRAGSRLVVKEADRRAVGRLMDAARDALGASRLDEAEKHLRELVRIDPTHLAAIYQLAQLVEPEEGLSLCKRLIAMEPRVPRGLLLRARILSDPRRPEVMDLDAAMESIERARRLNRDETGGAFQKGRILLLKGEVEQAVKVLTRVRANKRAAALAALGLMRLERPGDALALLGRSGPEGPAGILEEGDTAARGVGEKDLLARLITMGRAQRWEIIRLPLETMEAAECAFVDCDGDGTLDARVANRAVLLRGKRPWKVVDLPHAPPCISPRVRPYFFDEAAAWALDPPALSDGPPPGTTATFEADVDGDGDQDLLVVCGGDDPTAPLPWWVLLKEAGGYRPVRGEPLTPGFGAVAIAAADLDGDGRAEVLVKEGALLAGHGGRTWIASLR